MSTWLRKHRSCNLEQSFTKSASRKLADEASNVVLLHVSTVVSGGARDSRANALGHPIGLDKRIVDWRSTNQYPAHLKPLCEMKTEEVGTRSQRSVSQLQPWKAPTVGVDAVDGTISR